MVEKLIILFPKLLKLFTLYQQHTHMAHSVGVESRLALEDMEARLWKAMVNAPCINTVNLLRPFQKDLHESLVMLSQLGVANVKISRARRRELAKFCDKVVKKYKYTSMGKPYVVMVRLEGIYVPVRMDREDICDYQRFTACVQEIVPMYDKVLDYSWQHWETCRSQTDFFLVK
jgi:hypothetical protein